MRHWYLSFIVLFFILSHASAQSVQGIVSDAVTHKPVFPATVVNVRTQQATYTDANGFYTIPAAMGDVIAFTCIGYNSLERIKPVSVIVATMNVRMEHIEYQLDEVILRPGVLTPYQVDSIERRKVYKLPLQRTHPSAVMNPASAIAELFSKKAKRTYQFQKDFAREELQKFIDTRYSQELVEELTGLEGDSVGFFMYAYPMPYDFARAATDLELRMWIRDSYKTWRRKQALDSAKGTSSE